MQYLRSLVASAMFGISLAAPAAEVTLTGWAFGNGSAVQASGPAVMAGTYSGWAGAFGGRLDDAGPFSTTAFRTYCIELEESFWFGRTAMTGYAVVDGASYFRARHLSTPSRPDGDTVTERLGQLITWMNADPSRVDTAAESTAMQLAVWNIVYDIDWSLAATSSFNDVSSHQAMATDMLAGARTLRSRYDVFALTRPGRQDFLLSALRVPEPSGLALVGLALALLPVARRRRGSWRATAAVATPARQPRPAQ